MTRPSLPKPPEFTGEHLRKALGREPTTDILIGKASFCLPLPVAAEIVNLRALLSRAADALEKHGESTLVTDIDAALPADIE